MNPHFGFWQKLERVLGRLFCSRERHAQKHRAVDQGRIDPARALQRCSDHRVQLLGFTGFLLRELYFKLP